MSVLILLPLLIFSNAHANPDKLVQCSEAIRAKGWTLQFAGEICNRSDEKSGEACLERVKKIYKNRGFSKALNVCRYGTTADQAQRCIEVLNREITDIDDSKFQLCEGGFDPQQAADCYKAMTTGAGSLRAKHALAACSGGNTAARAKACVQLVKSKIPALSDSAGEICAGGNGGEQAVECINGGRQRLVEAGITAHMSALVEMCRGNTLDRATQCVKEILQTQSNLTVQAAAEMCKFGNTSANALNCMKVYTQKGLAPIYSIPACKRMPFAEKTTGGGSADPAAGTH
jgi:hypothetical protein